MQTKRASLRVGVAVFLSLTLLGQGLAMAGYVVQPGDSLYQVATQYGITVDQIMAENRLASTLIHPGQTLVVSQGGTYTVRSGDTLSGIARGLGIELYELRMANNVWGDLIYPGQELMIPARTMTASSVDSYHIVRRGDTLYIIARRYGTSISALREANNLWSDHLDIGQTVIIPGGQLSSRTGATTSRYTHNELELMARLIYAEAAGESYQGQVAVAASVLNRVRDARYPDTVHGVIYQVVNGYYQYSPVLDGRINLTPNATAFAAAREAFGGSDPSRGANGFFNPAKTRNQWVRQQPVTVVIGNHVFFRS